MNISSDWKTINGSTDQVYDTLSDLRNMGKFMPEQISDWEAEKDRCSFKIQGMTSLSLRLEEQIPRQRLRLIPEGKSPFEFELLFHLRETGPNSTDAMVEVAADLNPMMAMMAKKPLQNLVDAIGKKLLGLSFLND